MLMVDELGQLTQLMLEDIRIVGEGPLVQIIPRLCVSPIGIAQDYVPRGEVQSGMILHCLLEQR